MPRHKKRHNKTKRCSINKHKNSKGVCVRVRGTPSLTPIKTPVHLKGTRKYSSKKNTFKSLARKTTFKSLLKSIGLIK